MIPGDRAGEVGVDRASCSGVGCYKAKASCRTEQGVANMTPLVFGVFKGQGQNAPWEEKSSTMERAGRAGCGAKEVGCTAESVGPSSGGLVCCRVTQGWVLMSKPCCGRKLGPWKELRN